MFVFFFTEWSQFTRQQVRYYVKGHESNSSTILTTKEESTLGGLRQRTVYGFQVRENTKKTTPGWGEYTPPIYKMTGQLLGTGNEEKNIVIFASQLNFQANMKFNLTIFHIMYEFTLLHNFNLFYFQAYVGDEDNTHVRIIVGATIGAFLLVAVIIGIVLYFVRRSLS